ncbi:double zinc ribbon and ankyrin repeat-containing protein 1 [Centroberyx affinis]|uniref:double zinc ribbon and ankyrin repeat-containing protein 1 n=1 Tax=Centroberyx affinis TaxID=166261 RepID=UPI003A5C2F70
MTAGSIMAPHILPLRLPPPGRAKHHIHTDTPIAIQSDSPDVLIFYTVDGSKPAGSAGSSRKYRGPVLLPQGRVTVRAVAVCSDGRESATVTKVFLVELVDSKPRKENEENFLQRDQQLSMQRMMGNASHRAPTGPRFLNSRLGTTPPGAPPPGAPPPGAPPPGAPSAASQLSLTASESFQSGLLKTLSSTQTSRIQRDTDFLRCARCLRHRPSDPFARFCPQCGAVVPPVPGQRPPPAEGGQTVQCVRCNSLVPVNTPTCVICEAPTAQLQPQAACSLQDHVVCVSCGSGNPAQISCCVSCESRLPPAAACWGHSAPSGPAAEQLLCCCTCKRINQPDARYCDWCGCKPGHAVSHVMCWRCGATSHPYAVYCTACSVFLEAPARPASCTGPAGGAADRTGPAGGAADRTGPAGGAPDRTGPAGGAVEPGSRVSHRPSHDATWQAAPSCGPSPSAALAPPTADGQTQTVGLFYPSGTELQRRERRETRESRPLLTAVSPGRGYWRKQLDHVCAHLRSYAQNHAPFRALLGEPRLGRMVSAVIQEDKHEVSLTVSFVSAGREKTQVRLSAPPHPNLSESGEGGGGAGGGAGGQGGGGAGGAQPAGRAGGLSSVTERSVNSGSLGSERSERRKPSTPKPAPTDSQLLTELGPGRGRVRLVQQLLDQGADPSCRGSDGRPALLVAVVNGHHDVLPVLVQRGADVNQQSGPMNNSALHEAAALGREGLQSAQVLLGCGSSLRRKNGGGQTAFDLAVSSGCAAMVSLLAARSGRGLLDKLGKLDKPKLNLDVF